MKVIDKPSKAVWPELFQRNIPDDREIDKAVEEIIANVRAHGDRALIDYADRFDHCHISRIELTPEEIDERASLVSAGVAEAIKKAAANIEAFHRAQLPPEIEVETTPGVRCIQRAVPIRRVGLYIPGGRAPLFSTVLMLALPARIAGCREIVLCTP